MSRRRADRLTVGLAAAGDRHAGTVSLVRSRGWRAGASAIGRPCADAAPTGVLETAEQALGTAGRATQDTVAVAVEGYEATPRHETVLFNLLTGFVVALRARCGSRRPGIRGGWWPAGNVRLGGRHIHHFVPGILLAFGSGARRRCSPTTPGSSSALAVPFGAGIGLTFDEAALLLDLRDVYWTREGVLSVQLSLGLAATLGGTILALRMLRRGEERVEAARPDPAAPTRPLSRADHAVAGEQLAVLLAGARRPRAGARARAGPPPGPARRRRRASARG